MDFLLPIGLQCDFGVCVPIGNPFSGPMADCPCWPEPGWKVDPRWLWLIPGYALAEGAIWVGQHRMARKPDIRQFDDAVREIERHCGRRLTNDERRMLHDAIHGQGFGFNDIVREGIEMFCPEKGAR